MYTYSPIEHHYTTTGEFFIICPRPILVDCSVDAAGKPNGVRKVDHNHWSITGYKTFQTLYGLLKSDYRNLQPAFILYRLGDGTLLRAGQAAIEKSGNREHAATHDGQDSFEHLVSDLEIAQMPELGKPELDLLVAPVARLRRGDIQKLPRVMQLVTL